MKLFTAFIACLTYLQSMAQPQPALRITHLTGGCYIYTTWQQYGGHAVSANGMYLVTGKGVVLLDAPWDTTQFQPLLDSIAARHHQQIVLDIATHSHEDRAGGFALLQKKGIPTWSTELTSQLCREHGKAPAARCFKGDTTFTVGGCRLQVYYPGEGHAKDNIVIWLGKDKVLYGACLFKSTAATDLGYIAESNLAAWPLTIRRVQKKFPDPAYVIPGHDDWTDKRSMEHTLQLLEAHRKEKVAK